MIAVDDQFPYEVHQVVEPLHVRPDGEVRAAPAVGARASLSSEVARSRQRRSRRGCGGLRRYLLTSGGVIIRNRQPFRKNYRIVYRKFIDLGELCQRRS